jgi:hypothetical protein
MRWWQNELLTKEQMKKKIGDIDAIIINKQQPNLVSAMSVIGCRYRNYH